MDKTAATAVDGAGGHHVYLNVRLIPGSRSVRVALSRESTASHVIDKCKETLNSDSDYLLAADFNGFEKQFNSQERLYHLVKKHIIWAGLDRQVQFFIRKKKKQAPTGGGETPLVDEDQGGEEPVSGMITPTIIIDEGHRRLGSADSNGFYRSNDGFFSWSSTTPSQDGGGQDEQMLMADQQFPSMNKDNNNSSSDSWSSQMNSMSYAELMQMADRQKRQIETNAGAVATKEMRLNSLRAQQQQVQQPIGGQNPGDTQAMLSSRLHQLRQQIKTEDSQLQHLRRLRAEVEDERRRSVTTRVDLQEARRVFAEKERQLKEAATRVHELMRQLDLVRRRRLILAKENELRRLDSAIDALSNGKLDKSEGGRGIGTTMVEIPTNMSSSSSQLHYQRPKAAIEPFKIVPPTHPSPSMMEKTDGSVGESSALRGGGDYAAYGVPPAEYLHSKGFVAAFTAMEEVLQQTTTTDARSTSAAAGSVDGGTKPIYAAPATGRITPSTNAIAVGHYAKSQANVDGRTSVQGSPLHGSAAGQVGEHQPDSSLPQPVIPKVNISINRRFQIANAAPLLYEERPPPDLIPASEKNKFSNYDAPSTSDSIEPSSAIPAPRMPENSIGIGGMTMANQPPRHDASMHPRGEADKFHFRNDTIRAAKRRSWAENHHLPTTDEAEHIRLLLARAQQKGKSSLNMSWIFDQSTTPAGPQGYYQPHRSAAPSITASFPPVSVVQSYSSGPSPEEEPGFMEEPTHPPPPPPATMPPSPPVDISIDYLNLAKPLENEEIAATQRQQQPFDEEPTRIRSEDMEMFELNDAMDDQQHAVLGKRQRRLASQPSGLYDETDEEDDEDERSAATVVEIVSSSDVQLKPAPTKGILRLKPKDESERGRRIRFDTLALLLDAALEGELELVKSCASKVPNVSTCTEEGITALHNAICAGYYEIVRFLVEAGADVNAEDGDGWTPLHCAASCNNLPMVKFLIERGACIFATTTNDHETPADKCEEDEEGFDGCSQFLFGIQEKLGILNGGRVYAAYDYEADHEDELDLKADDSLQILRREDEREKGWWWTKHESTGEEGYVPRNYLALYPRLAAQRAGGSLISAASPEVPPLDEGIVAVIPDCPEMEEITSSAKDSAAES